MKTFALDTREANCKWWAARDASMRNYANSTLYSEKDKIRAERMKAVLSLFYACKNIYISYGKKGISVKVDRAIAIRNRDLTVMENDWEKDGVEKKVSAQGIIYRFNANSKAVV